MFSLQISLRRRYPSMFIVLLGLCFFRLHAAKHHIEANYVENKKARHLSEGGIPSASVVTERLHSVRKRKRRLSQHTSDGERPQENQYGEGKLPEENENEIDCSKFEHLDELPPFCLGHDDEGGEDEDGEDGIFPSPVATPTRQPTIQVSQPPVDRPVRPPSLEEVSQGGMDEGVDFVENNVITLPVSLGLFKPGELSESRARVLASLVTKVMRILLDRYTPYRVEPSSRDDDRFVISRGADRRHLESLVSRLLDQGSDGQQTDLMRSGDAVKTARSGHQGRPLVFLYMSGVNVWESPVWDNWLQFFVSYSVFWPNGSPVTNTRNLESIEFSCQEVLNTTIEVGKFWAEMLEQDEDGRFVMREGVNWSEREKAGIKAVAKFGEEYEIDNVPSEGGSSIRSPPGSDRSNEFSEPLEMEWDIREWLGLGICTFTTVIATILMVVSALLHRRQAQKNLWGLTEQGVGELLNVGWSYQQQETGQLFLKVYDKGKAGYNDENSVLQGGIERIPTVAGTATTATPGSNRSPDDAS